MITLVLGSLLAVAALLYVLLPLFDVSAAPAVMRRAGRGSALADESAIDALREIEFDRATGKLSDDDYAALKAKYTRAALVELRSRESGPATEPANGTVPGETTDALDPAEAVVLRYRSLRGSCPTCGPRPEPDPAFCSSCGVYLKGECGHCGATVDTPASRFCANCGGSLAA